MVQARSVAGRGTPSRARKWALVKHSKMNCPRRQMEFPGSSVGKESACNAGNLGLIPGLGRYPGEGNGNPLQYSCGENPMDREPGRSQSMGSQESDMVKQLDHHQRENRCWQSKRFCWEGAPGGELQGGGARESCPCCLVHRLSFCYDWDEFLSCLWPIVLIQGLPWCCIHCSTKPDASKKDSGRW